MSQDLDARLAESVKQRDSLKAEMQKIEGRKEAAQKGLQNVEDAIREKNLDPGSLDDTLDKLTSAYTEALANFERDVATAQKTLAPYMEIR